MRSQFAHRASINQTALYLLFQFMLETALLLADFGMMLVIWVVQIILYPSFRYYQPNDLLRWHARYTQLITFFVLPLMFAQLAGHLWLLWENRSFAHVFMLLLIAAAWAITFFVEVPYHSKIAAGESLPENIAGLIRWNWPRTIAWSLVFALYCFAF